MTASAKLTTNEFVWRMVVLTLVGISLMLFAGVLTLQQKVDELSVKYSTALEDATDARFGEYRAQKQMEEMSHDCHR